MLSIVILAAVDGISVLAKTGLMSSIPVHDQNDKIQI